MSVQCKILTLRAVRYAAGTIKPQKKRWSATTTWAKTEQLNAVQLSPIHVCEGTICCKQNSSHLVGEQWASLSRMWRILTMAHNTQIYWILNNRKHSVSETGPVSVLRRGEEDTYSDESTWPVPWLRLALSKGLNRVGVSLPSSEDGNRFSFRNGVFSSI
jgi:hypothetical protein